MVRNCISRLTHNRVPSSTTQQIFHSSICNKQLVSRHEIRLFHHKIVIYYFCPNSVAAFLARLHAIYLASFPGIRFNLFLEPLDESVLSHLLQALDATGTLGQRAGFKANEAVGNRLKMQLRCIQRVEGVDFPPNNLFPKKRSWATN